MPHLPLFRIVFIDTDKRLFTVKEGLNRYRPNSFYPLDSVFEPQQFDAIDIANHLLKIDFRKLCFKYSNLIKGFRDMYPLKTNAYVRSHGSEKGEWIESPQLAVHKHPASSKAMLAKFHFCVAECTEGTLPRSVIDFLWRFFSFCIYDDKWLIESGCNEFDIELLEAWGVEWEWIMTGFSALARSGFAISQDASLLFDRMVGVRHHCPVERASRWKRDFDGDIPVHRAREYLDGFSVHDSSFEDRCLSKSWKTGMPFEPDLVEAICGNVYLDCVQVCTLFPGCGAFSREICEEKQVGLIKLLFSEWHDGAFRSDSLRGFIAVGQRLFDEVSESVAYTLRQQGGCVEEMELLETHLTLAKRFYGLYYERERSLWPYKDIFECAFKEDTGEGADFSLGLLHCCLRWEEHRRVEDIKSLPEFIKSLLSSLLFFGAKPKLCKSCGKPFFPISPNHKYCNRVAPQTGIRCSDLKGKGDRNSGYTGLGNRWQNIIKKQKASHRSNELAAEKYYKDLASYFHDEVGPLYQKSSLIEETLFDKWHKAVDGPSRAEYRRMPSGAFPPYFLIWDGQVVDGNAWFDISVVVEEYPDLLVPLCDLGKEKPFILSDVYRKEGDCFLVRGSWLLRSVLRYNKKQSEGFLPVPGLVESSFYVPTNEAVSGDFGLVVEIERARSHEYKKSGIAMCR